MRTRYVWFLVLALAVVALDQGTKIWADQRLASPKTLADFPDHPLTLTVPPEAAGQPLQQYLAQELSCTPDDQQARIAKAWLLIDGKVGPHDPTQTLQAGQQLKVQQREVVVVRDWWHHRFVRNPAAAWGLFRSIDYSLRRPLFIAISLLSIALIVYIFHRSRRDQRMLAVSLALILGGAVGNFIDRVRLGFVIDFIEWFVVVDREHLGPLLGLVDTFATVGREYHWPTFNIADVGISVGVVLLMIEVLRNRPGDETAAASATPTAAKPSGEAKA